MAPRAFAWLPAPAGRDGQWRMASAAPWAKAWWRGWKRRAESWKDGRRRTGRPGRGGPYFFSASRGESTSISSAAPTAA